MDFKVTSNLYNSDSMILYTAIQEPIYPNNAAAG